MRIGISANVRWVVAAVVMMAVLALGGQANAGTPVRAHPLVSSSRATYEAVLAPIIGGTGKVILTYSGSTWHGSAHLVDVQAGSEYTVVIVTPTSYDSGEFEPGAGDTYDAYDLCSFTPTHETASCSARGVSLGGASVLTPQSFGELLLTQIDRPVAQGAFDYTADLQPPAGQSASGSGWLQYGANEWSGHVRVEGLQPHTTYTWAIDIVDAWNSQGDPQGSHTISLCTIVTRRASSGHCKASGIPIGRDDIPPGSTTEVFDTNATVTAGPLT
jgi:hypothetical protein